MGRYSSTMPPRARSERARRRVFFCAEPLESRQLLSVAAMHTAIAPANNVPAAIGPVTPSASPTTGPNFVATGLVLAVPNSVQIRPGESIQAGSQSFTETIVIIVEPIASGTGASTPTTPAGPGSSTGVGTTSPTPSNGASETLGNTSITPLTAAVLAGPAGGNQTAVIVVVAPQPVVANFGPSTIPVTTQAILNTALLEEQPIPPPVLGQGFESGQTQGLDPRMEGLFKMPPAPVPLEPMIPAVDYIEPFQPAVEPAPAAQPAQPDEAPPAPAPVRNVEPAEVVPVEPAILTDWDKAPEFPILPPQSEARTEAETPTWSMAAMVGTAAIASGGYHLVMGGSNRFNQRWIPTRSSSKMTRRRKPTLM